MQSQEEIREKVCEGRSDKTRPRGFFTKAATPCFRTVLTTAYFFFILELLALKKNGVHAVPDPEPTLLDSNFVEPSNIQLLFRPSGQYTHFIHIWVPFNFSQLLLTPTLIFDQYHRYIKRWPKPFCKQVQEFAEISHSCLADKVNYFIKILDTLPQYEVSPVTNDFLTW